jgi:hypothetical protein
MKDLVLFFSGAGVSWLIALWYYKRASFDQQDALGKLGGELKPRNSLLDFERLLMAKPWEKKFVDNQEIWVCNADGTFQIHLGDLGDQFTEPWTAIHPDKHCNRQPVYLKIGSATIHELLFVSADGGRILVPVTKTRRLRNGGVEYYWSKESLAVKVCRIVGDYYIHKNLEGLAALSNVLLENGDE